MTKLDYGFDISNDPKGAFQGIGINDKCEGAISAEFLGIIRHEGEDYLIGKTTLAFGDNPNYLGKITARRATVNIFPDGTGTIFLDIAENDQTKKLEEEFNSKNITATSLQNIINHRYDSVVNEDEIYATAIRTDMFEKKKMVNDKLDGHLDAIGKRY